MTNFTIFHQEDVRVGKDKKLLMSNIIMGKELGEGNFSFVYEYVIFTKTL
jgi:hypothetical protein